MKTNIKDFLFSFPNGTASFSTHNWGSLFLTLLCFHQCWITLGSDLEVILKPWLPSLASWGGRWRYLVAESYPCQLVEPRSTPRVLNTKVWRELPRLVVTAAALQLPPHAGQGSPGLRT